MWEQWKQLETLFLGAPKSLQMVTLAIKLKVLAPWKKSYEQPGLHIKKQRHCFANKSPSSQSYGFSSSHRWMWKLDHKEGWVLKDRCFWTVVLEKTLERPSDCKEIKPVNPKGDQSGRNELKSLLIKVEREKVGLKLNIQKTKIMASNPITSWQIDVGTMETVRDFIFGGSKITADGDCSHEIKRKESYDQPR